MLRPVDLSSTEQGDHPGTLCTGPSSTAGKEHLLRPHSLSQGPCQCLPVGPSLLQAAARLGQEALQVACQLGLLLPQLSPQLPDLSLPGAGEPPEIRYKRARK